jgi:signal transduction histidine kinase
VPLIARGRVAGALTLAYTDSGRHYSRADVSLATELASHAAVAIENALLYREAQAQLKEKQQARVELDREHAFVRLLLEVTTAANEAPNLPEALRLTLDRVRAHTGWPVGHAWLVAANGALVSSAMWSTNDPQRFRTLRQVSESVRFLPGIGLPGHVLAIGQAVYVADLATDPTFLRSHFAPLDVRAAFAFPVRAGMEIVAVLEFFSARGVELDGEFLEVMEHVGTQLGRVVDRQRAADALQQAREHAEEALRTHDDVLRMLSHDLRNPLSTMSLAAGVLRNDGLDEQQRREQLDVLHRAIGHMRRLVEGLLDLKRVEAGHGISVEPKHVDVQSLLEDGCRLFQLEAEAKGIRIVRRDPPHETAVLADAERMLQVLWNLTGNAIKFTPAGGVVTLSAHPHTDAVLFSVTDTGPGISEENLPRLFDPYWQANRTARLGTGLGLPISKAIVEAHGGRIWVESVPGGGTTVHFTLPRPHNGLDP